MASWPPAVSWVCRWTGRSKLLPQGRHEAGSGRRAQQAGHVLDRQDVRAGVDDLLRQLQVVVQRVERLVRVQHVGGVAERHLRDGGAGLADGTDGRGHLVDVVEGVEDPEDVDAGGGGLVDEGHGDLLRVRGVADGVAAAEQHLQADVRQRFAQRCQPVPGVLAEEPQGDVVGGTAPGLDGEQLGQEAGHRRSGRHQVAGADAGGEQRLVRVAERGVSDGDGVLFAQGLGESFGPQLAAAAAGSPAGVRHR